MSQAIQPLRIQKGTSSSSPTKMNGAAVQRPLGELGLTERRRNSPSYNQSNKQAMFGGDSSPFDSSPFASNSPRLYWQNRDSASPTRLSAENQNIFGQRDSSPSAAKRSSLENLKRASRVKNSNMFAREQNQEYDPTTSPLIERPLATGRPLSSQVQGNTYSARGFDNSRNDKLQDKTKLPVYSPLKFVNQTDGFPEPQKSPTRGQASPAKSSLSKNSRYAQAQVFDPENGMWSDDEDSIAERQLPPGKSLHSHAKSVTFDAAPPQINEYEMTTPVPSSVASGSREGSYESAIEEEESSDRDSSVDHDDSFDASLEDTDKTPVVLPEDWRFMSPGVANEDLAAHMEDPFEGDQSSPAPGVNPTSAINARTSPARTDSVNSNGERRPLPPLPGLNMPVFPRPRSDSNNSLSATATRVSSSQRVLPSPPRPASITKSEIQGMGGCSMSIEDRLRLMMLQDEDKARSPAEEQRDRRLRRGDAREKSAEPMIDEVVDDGIKIHEDEIENDNVADLGEYQLPPRISRESILRKVKSQSQHMQESEYEYSSPVSSPDRQDVTILDPDTPLPSLEEQLPTADTEVSVMIKQEEDEESEVDVYSIPDMYQHAALAESMIGSNIGFGGFVSQGSRTSNQGDYDDDESHYSNDSAGEQFDIPKSNSATEDEAPPTPKAHSPAPTVQAPEGKTAHRMSLPQFASMLGDDDFGLSFDQYLTPTPPVIEEPTKTDVIIEPSRTAPPIDRPMTPIEQLDPPKFPGYGNDNDDEPKTPDSVIRHPISRGSTPESPSVPEPIATIKAPGSKLKTRPSLTPADTEVMAESRRQISAQHPVIPLISESKSDTSSLSDNGNSVRERSAREVSLETDHVTSVKRKSSLIPLEVPVEDLDEGLSIGLDKEFDRVMEAQKVAFALSLPSTETFSSISGFADDIAGQKTRVSLENNANVSKRVQKGYLMRQNTKMVVASSASHDSAEDPTDIRLPPTRGTRSAGNSPRKPSHTQTWTTEPWNGKMRRKSTRQSAGSPQKKSTNGPAPPMPGQPSNVASGLDSVTEDQVLPNAEELEDGTERGRLFVKVVGVKELDLPLPRGERSYFALTLDNGLHCVTTAWLELGKFAPIGQEFELVVLSDLEFQLTLQTKLEEPKPAQKPVVESPTKSPSKVQKPSTFSRVFASPRKRKELEMKQQEEAERVARQKQAEAQASKRNREPTAWDLLHRLVAKDGSFARSYVCLKDHESQAYGRPYSVDVPCFNEWATEEIRTISSMKSNRGSTAITTQRKAPYKIGKLELQLLFVPKPKDAKEEEMPKSMNACIRELQDAELATDKSWEGHLSQQGGDCPYWRRRFFRLEGSKLTAYHEATRQPRATINLAKASKLIDDRCALTQKEVSGRGGSRRKSAFAEEEEGYMFVEEGFRVRFGNGETIDFYADSAAEKEGWMRVLAEVVGKDFKKAKTWTDLVLAKQRAMAQTGPRPEQAQTKATSSGMRSAPPTPGPRYGSQMGKGGVAPPPVEKDARHAGPTAEQRRQKTKSMIF